MIPSSRQHDYVVDTVVTLEANENAGDDSDVYTSHDDCSSSID